MPNKENFIHCAGIEIKTSERELSHNGYSQVELSRDGDLLLLLMDMLSEEHTGDQKLNHNLTDHYMVSINVESGIRPSKLATRWLPSNLFNLWSAAPVS
jgi:hypothetical protein